MISKSTRKQIADMGLTEEDCPAAGFVYFQEGETQLMIGRAWRGHDVVWGGAADAPKPRINGILNPRTSFEACLEKSKQESKPFNMSDLNMVTLFRDRLVKEQEHSWMLALMRSDIEEANLRYFNAIERAEDNNDFLGAFCPWNRSVLHRLVFSLILTVLGPF